MFAEAPKWIRGPAIVDSDWIVVDRKRAEPYSPLSLRPRQLMYSLAGVRTRDDVVAFVGRFGLLKQGPSSEQLRESIAEFEEETHLLHSILRLGNALRGAVRGDPDQLTVIRAMTHVVAPMFQAPPADDKEMLMQTSKAISWLVSSRLDGTTIRIETTCDYDLPVSAPDVFALNVNPPNLLGWAYYDLAQVLTHREPMSTCPTCGRMFVPEDGRQRFCQPACASRARFRRFKQRKAAAQNQPEKRGRNHGKATRTR